MRERPSEINPSPCGTISGLDTVVQEHDAMASWPTDWLSNNTVKTFRAYLDDLLAHDSLPAVEDPPRISCLGWSWQAGPARWSSLAEPAHYRR
jgi:hypothetical protein